MDELTLAVFREHKPMHMLRLAGSQNMIHVHCAGNVWRSDFLVDDQPQDPCVYCFYCHRNIHGNGKP